MNYALHSLVDPEGLHPLDRLEDALQDLLRALLRLLLRRRGARLLLVEEVAGLPSRLAPLARLPWTVPPKPIIGHPQPCYYLAFCNKRRLGTPYPSVQIWSISKNTAPGCKNRLRYSRKRTVQSP